MSKIDHKKLLEHLEKKWGTRGCPLCGETRWNVSNSVYVMRDINELGMGMDPVYPVVIIMCINCGNSVLLNSIIAGISEPSPEEEVYGE